jgi:hypothetical protein
MNSNMRILIVDKFFQPRDPAQTDMYHVMSDAHYCTFSANPMEDVMTDNYDLLYLGIYHQSLDIDLHQLLLYNTKPVIIDQADNEEWVERNKIVMRPTIKWVLSRYLPNDAFEHYCHEQGFPYAWLPWYVNPDRFPVTGNKKYDLSFICSMYGRRKELAENMKGWAVINNKSVIVGEYFGERYAEIMAQSYMVYMECGRQCLTQKYIEASLCNCVLVGDKPHYPENELEVHSSVPENYTNMFSNREYVLRTFANKEWFLDKFNELLK